MENTSTIEKFSSNEKLLCFFFTMLAFVMMRPYFLWEQYFTPLFIFSFAVVLLVIFFNPNRFIDSSFIKYSFMLFALALISIFYTLIIHPTRSMNIFAILTFAVSSVFLLLEAKYKLKITKYFFNVLVVIFSLGILEYFLSVYGLLSPSGVARNQKLYTYFVYYFSVVPDFENPSSFYRFCSMFDEPGVVGTLSGLILFAFPKRDYKFFVFLLAGIISFSLSFYVLLVLFVLLNFKQDFKKSLLIIGVFLVFLMVFGKSTFDTQIGSRIGSNASNGLIEDNRTNARFDLFFEEFLVSDKIMFGDGIGFLENKGHDFDQCSWKMIFWERGIVGFSCLMIFLFLSYFKQGGYSYSTIILFIAYLAALYQRAYYLFSIEYFIVLYGGVLYLNNALKKPETG